MCQCHFCAKEYESVEFAIGNHQAFGCASEVNTETIVCHDGSKFDLSVFAWSKGSGVVPSPNQASVCDDCIEVWLEKGWIKEICSNYWAS